HWDEAIELRLSSEAPTGGFDLICIGTPPEFHVPLALAALGEKPAALQIEKPLCGPDMRQADSLAAQIPASPTKIFVGYDHVVGKAARRLTELLGDRVIGEVKTIDVEFREFWGGIFKAH